MASIEEKQKRDLILSALSARKMAYAPYSGYAVGAALLTKSGKVFCGGNIENASYGATNCAERTVFFQAVGAGEREFLAIAIAGGMKDEEPVDYAYPCGVCRQVMKEFCGDDFLILVVKSELDYQEYTLSQLFPHGFGGAAIR